MSFLGTPYHLCKADASQVPSLCQDLLPILFATWLQPILFRFGLIRHFVCFSEKDGYKDLVVREWVDKVVGIENPKSIKVGCSKPSGAESRLWSSTLAESSPVLFRRSDTRLWLADKV